MLVNFLKFNFDRIKAIYLFAATIVGAGILALPVKMAEAGFWPGMLMIVLVGVACIFSALYIAESFLRTREDLHLPGLALKYLGQWGYYLMFLGILICVYGALTGYFSAGGEILYEISDGKIPMKIGVLIYCLVGTLLIYFGIQAIKSSSLILFSIMLILFLTMVGFTAFHLNLKLLQPSQWSVMPLTFGILIFAFGGHTVIPSLGKVMRKDPQGLKLCCIVGVALPLILYLTWFFVILATIPFDSQTLEVSPLDTKTLTQAKHHGQPATIPLGNLIGGSILVLATFFALFSTFSSFLGFGISTKDSIVDFSKRKIDEKKALFLTVFPPLILAFFHPTIFLEALDFAGVYGDGIFLGILPALILLRARKLGEKEPEFICPGGKILPILVFLFFLSGMVYKTVTLFI